MLSLLVRSLVVDEVLPVAAAVIEVFPVVVVHVQAVHAPAAMVVLLHVAVAVAMAHSPRRKQPPARNSGTRHQQTELMMPCAGLSVGGIRGTIWAGKSLPTTVLLLEKASSLFGTWALQRYGSGERDM